MLAQQPSTEIIVEDLREDVMFDSQTSLKGVAGFECVGQSLTQIGERHIDVISAHILPGRLVVALSDSSIRFFDLECLDEKGRLFLRFLHKAMLSDIAIAMDHVDKWLVALDSSNAFYLLDCLSGSNALRDDSTSPINKVYTDCIKCLVMNEEHFFIAAVQSK